MIHLFPQIMPQDFCLACKGCCRFDDARSVWRPKVARTEQIFVDLQDKLDADQYLVTEQTGHGCQCVFLNEENNHCAVYAMRPAECIMYPFLLMRAAGSVVIGMHLSCPYVQEEEGSPYFEEKIQEVKTFCLEPGFLSFIDENPELIADYPTYLNEIKILFEIPS
jgi:Fe-S-cluster containining protein